MLKKVYSTIETPFYSEETYKKMTASVGIYLG